MTVRVLQIRSAPMHGTMLNVTSVSKDWGRAFSPFLLGPVIIDGLEAKNVENAWQFSKVYSHHHFINAPNEEWEHWRQEGFGSEHAFRYPMGKGRKPMYSWTREHGRMGYVEARKKIYIPLYRWAVFAYAPWQHLVNWYHRENEDVTLLDFDAYDHRAHRMSWEDVVNDPKRKMGHAFVLAMMLEGVDIEAICAS